MKREIYEKIKPYIKCCMNAKDCVDFGFNIEEENIPCTIFKAKALNPDSDNIIWIGKHTTWNMAQMVQAFYNNNEDLGTVL